MALEAASSRWLDLLLFIGWLARVQEPSLAESFVSQEEAVEELVGVVHFLFHRVAIFQGLLGLYCRLMGIKCLIALLCHRWLVHLWITFFSRRQIEHIQRLSSQVRYFLLALHDFKMLYRLVDTIEKGWPLARSDLASRQSILYILNYWFVYSLLSSGSLFLFWNGRAVAQQVPDRLGNVEIFSWYGGWLFVGRLRVAWLVLLLWMLDATLFFWI